MLPHKIQLSEYSKSGGVDGVLYKNGSVWQKPNDNRNVPYLNSNDSKRNLNLNWIENDWNGNCRFIAVRNFLYSPL